MLSLSVSDVKIQITILILRGGALSEIVTFDFCGRSVGGDGDFFDFEWELETSLDGESQIIKTGDPLHFNRSWSYLLSDVSVSSLPLPLNIDAAFADEDLTPSADF